MLQMKCCTEMYHKSYILSLVKRYPFPISNLMYMLHKAVFFTNKCGEFLYIESQLISKFLKIKLPAESYLNICSNYL